MAITGESLLIELKLQDKMYKKSLQDIHRQMKDFDKTVEKTKTNANKHFAGMFKKEDIKKQMDAVLNEINTQAKKRLNAVKGNAKLENRILERAAEARVQITRSAEQRITNLRKIGALQQNAAVKSGGGLVSGLTSAKGMVMGGIAGIGAMGISSAVSAGINKMNEYGEKAQELEKQFAHLQTTATTAGLGSIKSWQSQLEAVAIATGTNVEKIISITNEAVDAGLVKNADQAKVFADSVSKGSQLMGFGMESGADKIGKFMNAVGMTVEKTPELIDQLQQLNVMGDFPNGEAMLDILQKLTPTFKELSVNADPKQLMAMIASLTNAGVDAEKAETAMRGLAMCLKDVKREKLLELGVKGIDNTTGRINDWKALMESIKSGGTEIKSLFRGVDVNIFADAITNANTGLSAMEAQLKNTSNVTNKAFSEISKTSDFIRNQNEAIKTSIETDIGQAWNEAILSGETGFANFFVGLKDQIHVVTNLIGDDFNNAMRAIEEADKLQGINASVQDIQNSLQGISTQEGLQGVLGDLSKIKEIAPYNAQLINDILNNSEIGTEEKIKQINSLLEKTQQISAVLEQQMRMEASQEAIDGLSNGWAELANNANLFLIALGPIGAGIGLATELLQQITGFKIFDETTFESLDSANDKLKELQNEFDGLANKQELSDEEAERFNELNKEIIETQSEISNQQEKINKYVEIAGKNYNENLSIEKNMIIAKQEINKIDGMTAEKEQEILEKIQAKFIAENENKMVAESINHIKTAEADKVKEVIRQELILLKTRQMNLQAQLSELNVKGAGAGVGIGSGLSAEDQSRAQLLTKALNENQSAQKEVFDTTVGILKTTQDTTKATQEQGDAVKENADQQNEYVKTMSDQYDRMDAITLKEAELKGMKSDSVEYARLELQLAQEKLAMLIEENASAELTDKQRLSILDSELKIKDAIKKQRDEEEKKAKEKQKEQERLAKEAEKEREEERKAYEERQKQIEDERKAKLKIRLDAAKSYRDEFNALQLNYNRQKLNNKETITSMNYIQDGKLKTYKMNTTTYKSQLRELEILEKQLQIHEEYGKMIEDVRIAQGKKKNETSTEMEILKKRRDELKENAEKQIELELIAKRKNQMESMQNELFSHRSELYSEQFKQEKELLEWKKQQIKFIEDGNFTAEERIKITKDINIEYKRSLELIKKQHLEEARTEYLDKNMKYYENQSEYLNEDIQLLELQGDKEDEIIKDYDDKIALAKDKLSFMQDENYSLHEIQVQEINILQLEKERDGVNQSILDKQDAQIQNITQGINQMNSLIQGAKGFAEALKSGNVSGILGSAGGIASQFGATGQMIGAGLGVASTVAGLFKEGNEREKEQKKQAEELYNFYENINKLMDIRVNLMKDAVDAGIKINFNTESELELVKKIHKEQRLMHQEDKEANGEYEDAQTIRWQDPSNGKYYRTLSEITDEGLKQLAMQYKNNELIQAEVLIRSDTLGIIEKINELKTKESTIGLNDQEKIMLLQLESEIDYRKQIQDLWENNMDQQLKSYDNMLDYDINTKELLSSKLEYMKDITKEAEFQQMTLEEQNEFYDEMLDTITKISEVSDEMAKQQLDAYMKQIEAEKAKYLAMKMAWDLQNDIKLQSAIAMATANGQKFDIEAWYKNDEKLEYFNDLLDKGKATEDDIFENAQKRVLLQMKLNGISEDSDEYKKAELQMEQEMLEYMINTLNMDENSIKVLEQKVKIMEKQKQLGIDINGNSKKQIDTWDKLIDIYKQLGRYDDNEVVYWDAKIINAKKYLELLQKQGATQDEIAQASLDIYNLQLAKLEDIYGFKIRDIEHAKAMGKYQDDEDKYYEDLLETYKQQYKDMKNTVHTEEELYDIQEKIYEIEHRQTEEILDRNNARDDEMMRLVRKREELLKQYRLTGQGGEQIKDVEMEIRARMKTQGISDEDIEKTMSAFQQQKSYDVGGYVNETSPALVHKGELILNQDQQKNLLSKLISPSDMSLQGIQKAYEAKRQADVVNYQYNINYGGIGNGLVYNISANGNDDLVSKLNKLIKNFPQMVVEAIKQQGGDFNGLRK